eukprot:TRINITY_DN4465_c0_g3_i2.p1 TRINITY_DN4465_c0_g3~~TRINITY_DN4465_c0_g3_i2.p1  ORF type:complete len:562 (+),score=122.64 TRINITY_DN4465_c0_g3_i2:3-1688(+)
MPVGNAGPNAGFLALASRALLCPTVSVDPLDRTLNPLGLQLGGPLEEYRDYIGAMVGSWIILGSLLLVCSGIAWCVYRRISGTPVAPPRPAQRIDMRFAMMKARFGWLLMPVGFVYAGAAIGSSTTVVYATGVAVKVPAALLFVCFCLGLPGYCAATAWQTAEYAAYTTTAWGELSWVRRIFWGTGAWAAREDKRGSLSWCLLHRLVFDPYKPTYRCFMAVQLAVLLVMSSVAAYRPTTRDGCYGKTYAMAVTMGLFALFIWGARPYIAPSDNLLEGLIAAVQTVMLGMMLKAMGSDNPTQHWGVEAASVCARTAMWLVVVKFVADLCVFLKDELDAWRASRGGEGSLLQYLLYVVCFRKVIDSRTHYRLLHDEERAKQCDEEVEYYAPNDPLADLALGGPDSPHSASGLMEVGCASPAAWDTQSCRSNPLASPSLQRRESDGHPARGKEPSAAWAPPEAWRRRGSTESVLVGKFDTTITDFFPVTPGGPDDDQDIAEGIRGLPTEGGSLDAFGASGPGKALPNALAVDPAAVEEDLRGLHRLASDHCEGAWQSTCCAVAE